jgi:hypothetical protein
VSFTIAVGFGAIRFALSFPRISDWALLNSRLLV